MKRPFTLKHSIFFIIGLFMIAVVPYVVGIALQPAPTLAGLTSGTVSKTTGDEVARTVSALYGLNTEYSSTLPSRQTYYFGMTKGQDIVSLKEVLNDDPDTRIALTGIDAPGNENTYFSRETGEAIKKFHTKYKAELLDSFGRQAPSGVAAGSVRDKILALSQKRIAWFKSRDQLINDIQNGKVKEADIVTRLSKQFTGNNEDKKLYIVSVSPSLVRPNDTVTVYGVGFKYFQNLELFISGTGIRNGLFAPLTIDPNNNYKATATIPGGLTGKNGATFKAQVTTTATATGTRSGKKTAVITLYVPEEVATLPNFTGNTTGKNAPFITKLIPDRAWYTDTVTAIGGNFTPTNNQIWTPYGLITGLSSSDGKTLTFNMGSLTPLQRLRNMRKELHDDDKRNPIPTQIKMRIGVLNDNGGSPQQVFFTAVIW